MGIHEYGQRWMPNKSNTHTHTPNTRQYARANLHTITALMVDACSFVAFFVVFYHWFLVSWTMVKVSYELEGSYVIAWVQHHAWFLFGGWTLHTTYAPFWVWEGVVFEALAYIVYISEELIYSRCVHSD